MHDLSEMWYEEFLLRWLYLGRPAIVMRYSGRWVEVKCDSDQYYMMASTIRGSQSHELFFQLIADMLRTCKFLYYENSHHYRCSIKWCLEPVQRAYSQIFLH